MEGYAVEVKELIGMEKAYLDIRRDYRPAVYEIQKVLQKVYDMVYQFVTRLGQKTTYRNILSIKLTRAEKTYGYCRQYFFKKFEAEYGFTKYLFYKGNEANVIEVMAHESLHGILGFGIKHGPVFQYCAKELNEAFGFHIHTYSHGKLLKKEDQPYLEICEKCGEIVGRFFTRTAEWKAIRENKKRYRHCDDDGAIIAMTIEEYKAKYEEKRINLLLPDIKADFPEAYQNSHRYEAIALF